MCCQRLPFILIGPSTLFGPCDSEDLLADCSFLFYEELNKSQAAISSVLDVSR